MLPQIVRDGQKALDGHQTVAKGKEDEWRSFEEEEKCVGRSSGVGS